MTKRTTRLATSMWTFLGACVSAYVCRINMLALRLPRWMQVYVHVGIHVRNVCVLIVEPTVQCCILCMCFAMSTAIDS